MATIQEKYLNLPIFLQNEFSIKFKEWEEKINSFSEEFKNITIEIFDLFNIGHYCNKYDELKQKVIEMRNYNAHSESKYIIEDFIDFIEIKKQDCETGNNDDYIEDEEKTKEIFFKYQRLYFVVLETMKYPNNIIQNKMYQNYDFTKQNFYYYRDVFSFILHFIDASSEIFNSINSLKITIPDKTLKQKTPSDICYF